MVEPPTGARSQTEARAGLSIDLPVAPEPKADRSVRARATSVRRAADAPIAPSPYSLFRRLKRTKPTWAVGVGVIGYGYWGPNLVRNFADQVSARVVAVSDLSVERLTQVHARYPKVKLTTDFRDVLSDPDVDAVIVATPVSSHFDIAMRALEAGKHVLVTKPITASSEQTIQLIEAAEQRGLVLMVDHTFVYTGAVQTIKQMVEGGNLGQLYYYDSTRVNLGLFQRDVNVLWDLAVHDLAIMDYVLGQRPVAVAATGAAAPGEPGLFDVLLRGQSDHSPPRQLVGPVEDPPHADRGRAPDDRLRRPRA
jgi:predicted dehydrogenase